MLPRGVQSLGIAQAQNDLGFIQGKIMMNPPPEMGRHHPSEAAKGPGGFRDQPAAPALRRLGQLPVVEGYPGGDSPGETGVYHPVIIGQAPGVPGSVPQGVHPGPAGGEAVVPDAQLGQDVQVFLKAVVAVAGCGAVAASGDGPRAAAEGVPYGFPAAVQTGVALGLISAGGGAPDKILSKSHALTP